VARKPVATTYISALSAREAGGLMCATLAKRRWIPELRFINSYHDANGFVSALCHEPKVSLAVLRGLLEEMQAYFAGFGGGEAEAGAPLEGPATETSAAAPSAAGAPTGPIQTRAEAIRRLEEVGQFFRRTEPHSPISYLVARAVKWGSMPLEKLSSPGAAGSTTSHCV